MSYEDLHIYIVEGADQVASLEKFMADRRIAADAANAWCVSQGGKHGTFWNGSILYGVVAANDRIIPDGWKRAKYQSGAKTGEVVWSPNARTNLGKSIQINLQSLRIPGLDELPGAIGAKNSDIHFDRNMQQTVMRRSSCHLSNGTWFLFDLKQDSKPGDPPEPAPDHPGCRLLKLSEFFAMKEAAEAAA